jgi:hypothetical protein
MGVVGSAEGIVSSSSSVSSTAITVRVNSRVKLVGDIGVVGTGRVGARMSVVGSGCSVGTVGIVSTVGVASALANLDQTGRVADVGRSAATMVSSAAITVGVDSGVKLVGNIGAVWTGSV